MLIGIEYVVAAYAIWLLTFVVYIFLTKRRLKQTRQAVTAIEQRASKSSASFPFENNK